MFKEAIKPKLRGLEIILILPSCSWKCRAMAGVPSVEPSSTIKISKLRQVCPTTADSDWAKYFSTL
ncbi:Hypothetical protein NGK_2633 [Neisseria gonorrhoeae NCCP11945]|uniref:Uncharacterized protein n=1 Tax=Neisseria gonorrhoeae (strain NCCP11945) TaxID=521006 RepID=B4RJG7_NEIG2|nr:Hypothetical protein NGK_2633 [Neisseria gonorrhoeae NCCP11945]